MGVFTRECLYVDDFLRGSFRCALGSIRAKLWNEDIYSNQCYRGVITADSSHMMFYQLYKVMDMQFTVHCEGCITHLLTDNLQRLAHLLQHVRTILVEGDMGTKAPDCFKDCVDYEVWKRRFIDVGFVVIEETPDPTLMLLI
mmetsp:Transcript_28191/g.30797  ORF Transcript_28191/g.30797 Transcript_28191/m.30797 type:complete len:142 (+) Transcript_28191:497-922(+)